MTRAVVSREAYGVRGACSRCRMCGAVRKREQAPRTPYASRGLVPVMPAWGDRRALPAAVTEALRGGIVSSVRTVASGAWEKPRALAFREERARSVKATVRRCAMLGRDRRAGR